MAESSFDFSTTNLIMTIGGHLVLLFIILFLVLSDASPIGFPTKNVKNMIHASFKK